MASCLRRTANWSKLNPVHKFDKPSFDPSILLADLPLASPKMDKLLSKIRELDTNDMKTHGKKFKHFIFSEVKSGGYGAKIIASSLVASGMRLAYDKTLNLVDDAMLLKTDNFALLSSVAVYEKTITVKQKARILAKYNERPGNVHGDFIRIIVMDAGYKEGIDLFDVKYVHIFEPQVSTADKKQVIGRATRTCGQSSLEFHPNEGWQLEVFIYDVSTPDGSTLFSKFMQNSTYDLKRLAMADELEKVSILGAVDYELNASIHNFKLEEKDETYDSDMTITMVGGDGVAADVISCDAPCGKVPTKKVPTSLPLMAAVYFSQNRKQIDIKFNKITKAREYFCALRKDAVYCKGLQQAFRNPKGYFGKYKAELVKALHMNKHYCLPGNSRKAFSRYVRSILGLTSTLEIADSPVPIVPKKFPFTAMREYVSDNYQQFAWPKVKLENLCQHAQIGGNGLKEFHDKRNEMVEMLINEHKHLYELQQSLDVGNSSSMMIFGGAAPTILKYTPTQDFVRHFFTPQTPYKGMLLWHSVGTGKTATAIATASTSFEPEYTILWVTRSSLKSDIWKNMFDKVAHAGLQKMLLEGKEIGDNNLSKSWGIRPLSYRQFTNLVSGKNKAYMDLVKRNGASDPLHKTLIIIDEAHKLYGGNDLSSMERPDMKKLKEAIFHSYVHSGKDSVRLLLMTATPYTNDPLELIKLLNLLRLPDDQLPEEFDDFANTYFRTGETTFSKKGKFRYLNDISGYISYLSREKDARQFAQPRVHTVLAPQSMAIVDSKELEKTMESIEMVQKEKAVRQEQKKVLYTDGEIREKAKECKTHKNKSNKTQCQHELAFLREEMKNNIQMIRVEDDIDKAKLKNLKSEYKAKKKQLLEKYALAQSTVIDKCIS